MSNEYVEHEQCRTPNGAWRDALTKEPNGKGGAAAIGCIADVCYVDPQAVRKLYNEAVGGPDANNDNHVNVSDAVYIINYIFSGGPSPVPIHAADANGSGSVNVSDAVYLINYIFISGPAPICEGL